MSGEGALAREADIKTKNTAKTGGRLREPAIAALFAVLVGLFFGLSYGVGNQNTYLLQGLRLADPDFLRVDWLASQTYFYHPTFSQIVRFLASFGAPEWNFALANTLVITIALLGIYFLTVVINKRDALAITLLLYLFVLAERTMSIGVSHIFDLVLQPATLAGAALVLAMAAFLNGRFWLSGLFLGLSGFAHVNYLLLGILIFGFAHLLLGFASLPGRLFKQFALSLLALAFFMPHLITVTFSENAEFARLIYTQIRSPHHHVPAAYKYSFIPFIGWHLIALAFWPLLSENQALRNRLAALYVVLLGLIAAATFLTTAVFIPAVSQMFFARVAPYSVLLAQIVIACRLIPMLRSQAQTRAWAQSYWRPLVALAGLGLWAGSKILWPNRQMSINLTIAVVLTLFLLLNLVVSPGSKLKQRRIRVPAYALPLLLLIVGLIIQIKPWYERSTLLNDFPGPEQQALYDWAQTTDEEALILTPPDMAEFRLRGERAIVADWKSTPILPNELVEWYRRIGMMAGDPNVQNEDDVIAGYQAMDASRLNALDAEFQLDYAVFQQPMRANTFPQPVVFENETFIVFDLRNGG